MTSLVLDAFRLRYDLQCETEAAMLQLNLRIAKLCRRLACFAIRSFYIYSPFWLNKLCMSKIHYELSLLIDSSAKARLM